MMAPTMTASGMLEDDALDDVGDVLATIGRALERFVDLLPLHDEQWIGGLAEELRDGVAKDLVALVLESVHLDARVENDLGLLQIAEPAHGHHQRLRGSDEHVG